MKNFMTLLLATGWALMLNAQPGQAPSPIIFIYDASGSMLGRIQGKTKMDIATDVLSNAVDKLPADQKLGLVAYGHRKKDDCQDVEFLVDVENGTKSGVSQSLKGLKPLGKTPLAYSATQVINLLRQTKMKATIILITDGIESCGGKICDVIGAAVKEGINLRLHIVGFGLKAGETEELKCAAKAGNGNYYDAADAGGLGDILTEATATTVDEPPGNFTVYAVKNKQPLDALIKVMKPGTKTELKSIRTYRDTALFFLPPGKYDFLVNPLENSDISAVTIPNVESYSDRVNHQTVSFDGGKFRVTTTNNGEGWDAVVKVFARGTNNTVASGRTYGRSPQFEVNAGVYDVEVTAMVIEGNGIKHRIKNLEIVPGQVNSVTHEYQTGIAMIGAKAPDGLVDAIVKVIDTNTKETVATGRTYTASSSNPKKFILTPGRYTVTVNGLGKHAGKNESFSLDLKQGETKEKIASL